MDFLDHLITRSLGGGAAIRPRSPALFESPFEPANVPEEWAPEPPEPAIPAPPFADRPAASSPASPPLLSPPARSPQPGSPQPAALPATGLPATAPSTRDLPAFALPPPALPAVASSATASVTTALPATTSPAVAPFEGAEMRPAAVSLGAAPPVVGGVVLAGAAGSPPRLLAPSREVGSPVSRRRHGASAPLPPAPAGTRVTSSAKTSDARGAGMTPVGTGEWAWPPAPDSSLSRGTDNSVERVRWGSEPSAQPVPTIQVTIGRVEVRASAQAKPERRASRAPSVMSLDEYLKRAR